MSTRHIICENCKIPLHLWSHCYAFSIWSIRNFCSEVPYIWSEYNLFLLFSEILQEEKFIFLAITVKKWPGLKIWMTLFYRYHFSVPRKCLTSPLISKCLGHCQASSVQTENFNAECASQQVFFFNDCSSFCDFREDDAGKISQALLGERGRKKFIFLTLELFKIKT